MNFLVAENKSPLGEKELLVCPSSPEVFGPHAQIVGKNEVDPLPQACYFLTAGIHLASLAMQILGK